MGTYCVNVSNPHETRCVSLQLIIVLMYRSVSRHFIRCIGVSNFNRLRHRVNPKSPQFETDGTRKWAQEFFYILFTITHTSIPLFFIFKFLKEKELPVTDAVHLK